jgi:hypothetical protein
VLNNPLRYVDPTGFYEEETIKKWYPEWWEIWKNNYGRFWEMLLMAKDDDIVEANFGVLKAWFGSTRAGKPILTIRGSELDIPIDEWEGAPRVNNYYNYLLRYTDYDGESATKLFGATSSEWNCAYAGGILCEAEVRYLYRKGIMPGRDSSAVPDSATLPSFPKGTGVAVSTLGKVIDSRISKAWTVGKIAALGVDIFTTLVVRTERRVYFDRGIWRGPEGAVGVHPE